jgi:hypothetical protein
VPDSGLCGHDRARVTPSAQEVANADGRAVEVLTARAVPAYFRIGAAGTKKYVLSTSTETCTLFGLGGRDLTSFRDLGVTQFEPESDDLVR